jgi:hypothetical protein
MAVRDCCRHDLPMSLSRPKSRGRATVGRVQRRSIGVADSEPRTPPPETSTTVDMLTVSLARGLAAPADAASLRDRVPQGGQRTTACTASASGDIRLRHVPGQFDILIPKSAIRQLHLYEPWPGPGESSVWYFGWEADGINYGALMEGPGLAVHEYEIGECADEFAKLLGLAISTTPYDTTIRS